MGLEWTTITIYDTETQDPVLTYTEKPMQATPFTFDVKERKETWKEIVKRIVGDDAIVKETDFSRLILRVPTESFERVAEQVLQQRHKALILATDDKPTNENQVRVIDANNRGDFNVSKDMMNLIIPDIHRVAWRS